jgi:PKD repeat protein
MSQDSHESLREEQTDLTVDGTARRRRTLWATIAALLFVLMCVLLAVLIFGLAFSISADAQCPAQVEEGQSFTCNGSGSPDWVIREYTWDFGDGSIGSGANPSHSYDDGPAEYSVTLTITDSRRRTASATTQVTVEGLPPSADAGGPYQCQPGEDIQFSGTCNDPSSIDAESLSLSWADFNGADIGGSIYTCPDSPGDVTVTLTCTDKDGASAQDSVPVQVLLAPSAESTPVPTTEPPGDGQPPVAVIEVTPAEESERCYRFDGSDSSHPDGEIVSYAWAFGDGNMGAGAVFGYCYTASGRYITTLTVTGEDGITGSSSVVIRIP